MKFVSTIIFEIEDSFQDRKPDVDMLKRYLSARIRKGEVDEDNLRGRVVMSISRVHAGVMDID